MPVPNRYPNRVSPPISRHDGLTAICRFFARPKEERSEAVLTTVGPDQRPHACWMATLVAPTFDTLIAITSPDSRKVSNIRQNPRVEWMLTSPNMREVVYVRGDVQVIVEPAQVFQYWTQLPEVSRPYFLRVHHDGMAFMLLKTAIKEFEYCIPSENIFVAVSLAAVQAHVQSSDGVGASDSG